MDPKSVMCINCGAMQDGGGVQTSSATFQSEKRVLPAALLCFFLGIFGAHRFYVGKSAPASFNSSRSADSAFGG
jgi:hypothetical protein